MASLPPRWDLVCWVPSKGPSCCWGGGTTLVVCFGSHTPHTTSFTHTLPRYDILSVPLDETLLSPNASPVCRITLYIENERIRSSRARRRAARRRSRVPLPPGSSSGSSSTASTGLVGSGTGAGAAAGYASVFVAVHLPWVTRRCAVTRYAVEEVPLVTACIEWLQVLRDTLMNRIRWVYHATLYTGQPAFGGSADGGEGEEAAQYGVGYPFKNLPPAPEEAVDLSAYGADSGHEIKVFGAGAGASPFQFGGAPPPPPAAGGGAGAGAGAGTRKTLTQTRSFATSRRRLGTIDEVPLPKATWVSDETTPSAAAGFGPGRFV